MPSGAIGKCLLLASPLKVEEETKVINEKQGIVSILLSEPTQAKIATSSLRRNLSADMSSGKWLAQNGLLSSSMKKIASSEQLAVSLEENQDEEKAPGQDDVWRSIQLKKKTEVENGKPACTQLDTWSSILSQNAKEDSNNLPPYVHPLVKTSTSSLSEKSLQICTESLGSETGSEGFSSYPSSKKSESEEDKEEEEEEVQQKEVPVEKYSDPCDRDEWQAIKCMYSTKSTTPRSFPPPLPSLAQSVGPTLHMQSRRLEGRLLLEAVSVPSQNCFHAQRQDGRLVLQLHDNQNLSEMNDEDAIDLLEDPVDDIDIDIDIDIDEDFESELEDEMDEEMEEMVRQEPITAPRSAIPFKNNMRNDNKNTAWPTNRINKEEIEVESDQEEKELEELAAMPQSLPPVARLIRSPAGAAGSFNAYDYFWRTKPTMINPINQQSPAQKYSNNMTILPNSSKADKQQEPVFLRGNNAEYLVPLVRGCNDSSKRSLQICEPYCVATS